MPNRWGLILSLLLLFAITGASTRAETESPIENIGSGFDPMAAPFIPIPEIDVDPNAGTTLGIFPVWLITDKDENIRRIIAPDVLYNPYFGYGARGRIFAFPSDDSQWSVVGGAKQRVEREFDFEYASGRTRDERWSLNAQFSYDRSGIPRFYGIGNKTRSESETNYTDQQMLAVIDLGLNITHAWQLGYMMRVRQVDILPGTIDHITSIEQRFGAISQAGSTHEWLQRFAVTYDTRDNITVPTRGSRLTFYAGAATRSNPFTDSLYTETGIDVRQFSPIGNKTTIATHAALRYMPAVHNAPFWALSSIGGDRSVIGFDQPLRGFGEGRFRDRNAFSASIEVRNTVLSLNAFATHIDIELAPFVDIGKVSATTNSSLFSELHKVVGLGFRAIAKPFVVGYVDVGYGSEGAAVFTGIDYPF